MKQTTKAILKILFGDDWRDPIQPGEEKANADNYIYADEGRYLLLLTDALAQKIYLSDFENSDNTFATVWRGVLSIFAGAIDNFIQTSVILNEVRTNFESVCELENHLMKLEQSIDDVNVTKWLAVVSKQLQKYA